jgi:hypothetical protein
MWLKNRQTLNQTLRAAVTRKSPGTSTRCNLAVGVDEQDRQKVHRNYVLAYQLGSFVRKSDCAFLKWELFSAFASSHNVINI